MLSIEWQQVELLPSALRGRLFSHPDFHTAHEFKERPVSKFSNVQLLGWMMSLRPIDTALPLPPVRKATSPTHDKNTKRSREKVLRTLVFGT